MDYAGRLARYCGKALERVMKYWEIYVRDSKIADGWFPANATLFSVIVSVRNEPEIRENLDADSIKCLMAYDKGYAGDKKERFRCRAV